MGSGWAAATVVSHPGGGVQGLLGPCHPEYATQSLAKPFCLSLLLSILTRACSTPGPHWSTQEGDPGIFPGHPVPKVRGLGTLALVGQEGGKSQKRHSVLSALLLQSLSESPVQWKQIRGYVPLIQSLPDFWCQPYMPPFFVLCMCHHSCWSDALMSCLRCFSISRGTFLCCFNLPL